jgi:hypothetical protein
MYMHFIELPPLARHTLYNKVVAILDKVDADDDIVWYIEEKLTEEFEAACEYFLSDGYTPSKKVAAEPIGCKGMKCSFYESQAACEICQRES